MAGPSKISGLCFRPLDHNVDDVASFCVLYVVLFRYNAKQLTHPCTLSGLIIGASLCSSFKPGVVWSKHNKSRALADLRTAAEWQSLSGMRSGI